MQQVITSLRVFRPQDGDIVLVGYNGQANPAELSRVLDQVGKELAVKITFVVYNSAKTNSITWTRYGQTNWVYAMLSRSMKDILL